MKESINIDMDIFIDGMGIVFYSEGAVKDIKEGENYFESEYEDPDSVAKHIRKGDVVGFCTGSPGNYLLKFRDGIPNEKVRENYPICIYLAIKIDGGKLFVKDLFWLMDWKAECPMNQQLNIDDGVYEMRVYTAVPPSGYYGDNQIIYIYLNKVNEMPQLAWCGVPPLYKEF